ncbi:MAG TPA: PilZ domain-containing protein [Vicinamibacterales bacterium]|nr:PilZ domain-containing protein [Vicinamibacterales bacterium]
MPSAVVIGAADLLPALVARAGLDDDVLTFSDAEPLEALAAITEHRPRLVVLERLFAATSRGAALISRLKSDPALDALEIRVLSHTGDYARVVSRPAPAKPASAPAEPARPLDWRGTRRAPRYRVRPGLEIQLDGNPVQLVDVSVMGAQVVSPTVLRPNQRVRVTLVHDSRPLRFQAAIAWARFELPRSASTPHYRAGLEFADAPTADLERFCRDNQA